MVRNFSGGEKRTNSSEQFVADSHALLQHFDLSRNTSLRTLETTALSIDYMNDAASDFFITILSSITSPAPLDFVIIYRHWDFGFISNSSIFDSGPASSYYYPPKTRKDNALFYQKQFGVFREMHRVRDFSLVLCADVFDSVVGYAIGTLERHAKAEKVKGGLDHLREPLVISERRSIRTRPFDFEPGSSRDPFFSASAL